MNKELTPPHNTEAEEALLGSIFLDPQILPDILEEIRSNDFYNQQYQLIFRIIEDLFDKGLPVDVITVMENLRNANLLEKAGGEDKLIYLAEVVPTPANALYYAKIIKDKSLLRSLVSASTEIVEATRTIGEAEEILDFAEKKIFEIAESRATRTYDSVPNIVHDVFEKLDELKKRASIEPNALVTGLPTGFISLDRLTSGFHKSDLIIIAARPSMGKTAFALNVASNLAIKYKTPIAMFNLEMSKEQLVQRVLCAEAQVDLQKVRTGMLSNDDWNKLVNAAHKLSQSKIVVDDEPGLDPRTLRAKARRMKREYGIEAIFIDYLQLMSSKGRASESRQQEISEISRSLKLLARELNVVIVALSQLSRAVEQREDKRPRLSDLRESGAIEQDADMVMFLYRDAYYKRKKESDNKDKNNENLILNHPHESELIIGKQRNGPVGTIKLMFDPKVTLFYERDSIHKEKY
ncbi:replicative DNA helicase [Marinitoga arctica]